MTELVERIIAYVAVTGLLLVAGSASGLTVGFLSYDPVQLEALISESPPHKEKSLKRVLYLINTHHDLLVTLLVVNCIAVEFLPKYMEQTGLPENVAIWLSVFMILIFGEIMPQSICLSSYQLDILIIYSPIIYVIMYVMYPIRWPFARILDEIFKGELKSRYRRCHLKKLISMHEKDDTRTGVNEVGSILGHDEVKILEGALNLAKKTLKDIMVPFDQVFMLECGQEYTENLVNLISFKGYSRIPVYRGKRHCIQGLILAKSLLQQNHNSHQIVENVMTVRRLIFASPDASIYDILSEFQKGISHICFVTHNYKIYTEYLNNMTEYPEYCEILGIVTLEDVFEELIQKKIYDEFDVADDGSKFCEKSTFSQEGEESCFIRMNTKTLEEVTLLKKP